MNVISLYLCSYVVPSMYVVVVLGSLQKIQYLPLLVTERSQLVHELCQKKTRTNQNHTNPAIIILGTSTMQHKIKNNAY